MKNKSEIFISYRRDGGEFFAKKLRDTLVKNHYHAFLDIEGLGSGNFNEHLLEAIDSSYDYILLLSKNSLDRCINDDDWVRKEIEYAKLKQKHFIILINKDFSFPENLPSNLDFLRNNNNIDYIEYEVIDDIPILMKSIKEKLITKSHKYEIFLHKILPSLLGIFFAIGIAVFIAFGINKVNNKFPKTKDDEVLIENVFAYIDKNLEIIEKISMEFEAFLDICNNYYENPHKIHISEPIKIMENLYVDLNNIDLKEFELDSTIADDIIESHFSKDDIQSLSLNLESLYTMILDNINYFAELLYYPDENENTNKIIELIQSIKQDMTSLKEYDVYVVNIILNSVTTSYKPLSEYKSSLAKYEYFNFADYEWFSSDIIIKIYKKLISEDEEKLLNLNNQINEEIEKYEKEIEENVIKNFIENGYTKEEAYTFLRKHEESEAIKKELIQERLRLLLLDKNELNENLNFQEKDDAKILYLKTRMAYKNGYYDIVIKNLEIFEKYAPDYIKNISKIKTNFQLFSTICEKYNYIDILIINGFNGITENQKYFEIGDIIISVNHIPFKDFDEFKTLRLQESISTLQILHNEENKLVLKNIECKGTLGIAVYTLGD